MVVSQYQVLKARTLHRTLHRWAGIEDGRHSNAEIMHFSNHDERFKTARTNILSVDTLIIDEVSMVSSKVLQQVQYLCKNVQKSKKIFGGIQVILVVDFY